MEDDVDINSLKFKVCDFIAQKILIPIVMGMVEVVDRFENYYCPIPEPDEYVEWWLDPEDPEPAVSKGYDGITNSEM